MAERVGVVAIQGDFAKHIEAFHGIGVEAREVRTPDDLESADRLVIPGGESTTVGLLLERFGLGDAIRERAAEGMPVWGTCMGMILMAVEVEGRSQYNLGLLDVTVRRNAFGAQIHSFEDEIPFAPLGTEVTGVFIRAPIVIRLGPLVEALSTYDGKVVAVSQGRLLGTSYHPELTDDRRVHEWFMTV